MVPDIGLVQLLKGAGQMVTEKGDPILKGVYHFKPFVDKKKKVPNEWHERFPDGIQVQLTDKMLIFLLLTVGVASTFVFWDLLVDFLDKQGWRDKNNTTFHNLMGLGILGGVTDSVNKAGGQINKASSDFQKAVGKLGAQLQGK
jgi:hypothetical protein